MNAVQLQDGRSNALLSQIEASATGDLYIAADEAYITLGRKKNLIAEGIPLVVMRPVIAAQADSEKGILGIDDLLR